MKSCWEQTAESTPRQPLRGDLKADVLVIGGGMAGILCAHRLQEEGASCVVLEGMTVGCGTTGHTTAKITAQHGFIYAKLLRDLGPERASAYYQLHTRAVNAFEGLAQRFPCDFEKKTAYTYTLSDKEKLEREQEAYGRLSIPYAFEEHPPLPFPSAGALGMTGQAQFHPLKLLYALAKDLTVYEHSFVHTIHGHIAYTRHGTVTAKHILLATQFPLVNIPGGYFLKMYQHRSYVLALEGGAPALHDMYVDDRLDGHSFRRYQNLLLLGGGDHRTGKHGGGFAELRALAARAYPGVAERAAWAAQDCMPLDDLPYIGVHRRSTPHLSVATGFHKWGMTSAMAASMVLSDLILHGQSEFAALLSPQRSMMKPRLLTNVLSAGADLLTFGKRCPHMGCALKWNATEKSWDCPCHGSRFDEHGGILNGPSKRRLHP